MNIGTKNLETIEIWDYRILGLWNEIQPVNQRGKFMFCDPIRVDFEPVVKQRIEIIVNNF